MQYNFPYFGDINISDLAHYYKVALKGQYNTIEIDLNFQQKSIDPELADIVKAFLENISVHFQRSINFIREDFTTGIGETSAYITDLLDDLDKDDLLTMEDDPVKKKFYKVFGFGNKKKYLLGKLKPLRIGLHPDAEDDFAIFDYTVDINGEPCNQILAVKTDHKGELKSIDWES